MLNEGETPTAENRFVSYASEWHSDGDKKSLMPGNFAAIRHQRNILWVETNTDAPIIFPIELTQPIFSCYQNAISS